MTSAPNHKGFAANVPANCRSPLAYRDVGKGREQDAEALRAMLLFFVSIKSPASWLLQFEVIHGPGRKC